jgi:hypothetical protein
MSTRTRDELLRIVEAAALSGLVEPADVAKIRTESERPGRFSAAERERLMRLVHDSREWRQPLVSDVLAEAARPKRHGNPPAVRRADCAGPSGDLLQPLAS